MPLKGRIGCGRACLAGREADQTAEEQAALHEEACPSSSYPDLGSRNELRQHGRVGAIAD